MKHNGAMFKGSMNMLYQNLIVSNTKLVRIHFPQISRKKYSFTAPCSSFGSFERTTKIMKRTPRKR